ncbi:histidine kinase dimerization/phosphoacceptor domain -containing protein [Spirochaeta cellobiosiphila]|uniref:histidine kinase dimerization/phosphoacceptor domain -containing protein n=1 Tax=Spirochaeta cellobiosiphila TaxID=504483 RepID=UPI000424C665|nr:histidine kinase dimerization/phosphoacceptor domain -containing protein [Spirochaeta cellobiosiphila]
MSNNGYRFSVLTLLKATYIMFFILFGSLNLFIINEMRDIGELTELTYNHPFSVSNALLRIQLNIEKIKRAIAESPHWNQSQEELYLAQIKEWDKLIEDDFSVVKERFLGDMDRMNIAYREYEKWRSSRESRINQYMESGGGISTFGSMNNQLVFEREMEYLSVFAQNKASEYLNSSHVKSDKSITLAYILTFAALVIGFLIILNLITSIRNPLGVLIHAVEDIEKGLFDQQVFLGEGSKEFVLLADGFNKMVKKIKSSYKGLEDQVQQRTLELENTLSERDNLFRELYHRTKNNLQVISSILSLKADETDKKEIKTVIWDLEKKVQSMALVHQMLYRSDDLSHIYLDKYIAELLALIIGSFDRSDLNISLNTKLEHIPLVLDYAVPCGLIMNELITNSIKYAFPNLTEGEIFVSAKYNGNGYITIEYQDNGVGLPSDFSLEESQSLGFLLIKTIAENQMNGTVLFDGSKGMYCKVEFVDTHYSS